MNYVLKYGSREQDTNLYVALGHCEFTANSIEEAQEHSETKLQEWRSYEFSGLDNVEWKLKGNVYKKETKDRYFHKIPRNWKRHKGPYKYFSHLESV